MESWRHVPDITVRNHGAFCAISFRSAPVLSLQPPVRGPCPRSHGSRKNPAPARSTDAATDHLSCHSSQDDCRRSNGCGCLLVSGPLPSLAQSGPPNGLPEQASEQAEAQFEGELEVLYECDEDTGRLKHFLDVGNGKRLRLEFAGGLAPDLPTGSRIRARGRLQNEETLMLADAGSVQAISVSAGASTFGVRRVIVMLVNFQDNLTQPFSVATAQSVAFDQVNRFYQESSYGQTSVSGDVYGWFTLPMNSTTCDTGSIASLADQAAANAGVNLVGSHKMYAFPRISACSWSGLGSLGGNPSRAFMNGGFAVRTVAHELHHNLGIYHSRSQPCAAGTCSTVKTATPRRHGQAGLGRTQCVSEVPPRVVELRCIA